MEKRLLWFVLFLALAVWLAGCGGGMSTVSVPAPPVSGNYLISFTSAVTPQNNFSIGGKLQSDSSGIFDVHVKFVNSPASNDAFCAPPELVGSFDTRGLLSLHPAMVFSSESTFTFSAQFSADGLTITGGSYTLNGGPCAANDQGGVSGFRVQPTGTYSGSFVVNSTTMKTSVVLTEVDDNFAFSGLTAAATFTNATTCGLTSAGTITFETGNLSGSVVGTLVGLSLQDPNDRGTILNPHFIAGFSGVATDRSAKTINGTITIATGPCAGQSASLTLSRP